MHYKSAILDVPIVINEYGAYLNFIPDHFMGGFVFRFTFLFLIKPFDNLIPKIEWFLSNFLDYQYILIFVLLFKLFNSQWVSCGLRGLGCFSSLVPVGIYISLTRNCKHNKYKNKFPKLQFTSHFIQIRSTKITYTTTKWLRYTGWPLAKGMIGYENLFSEILKNNLVHHPGRPSSNQRVLSGLKYFFANDRPGSSAWASGVGD